jgi:hypothetical protein
MVSSLVARCPLPSPYFARFPPSVLPGTGRAGRTLHLRVWWLRLQHSIWVLLLASFATLKLGASSQVQRLLFLATPASNKTLMTLTSTCTTTLAAFGFFNWHHCLDHIRLHHSLQHRILHIGSASTLVFGLRFVLQPPPRLAVPHHH